MSAWGGHVAPASGGGVQRQRLAQTVGHPLRPIPDVVVGERDDTEAHQHQLRSPLLVSLPICAAGVRAMACHLHHEAAGEEGVDTSDEPAPGAPYLLQLGSGQPGAPNDAKEPALEPALPARVDEGIEQHEAVVDSLTVPGDDLRSEPLLTDEPQANRRVDRSFHLGTGEGKERRVEDQS